MLLESYIPHELLRPFVKCYVIVDCETGMQNSMLPDTSLILGFRYKGITKYIEGGSERALPFAVVAGLRTSVQLMNDGDNTGNLLVIFNAAGASAFIREPLHEMFGEVISLDECADFKKRLCEVEDRLCGAASDKERITIVEQFLLSRLHLPKTDPLVGAAIQAIRAGRGAVRVRQLAAGLHISLDAFEKRFRRAVGASPKQFCNIIRMNAAISGLHTGSIVEAALDAGYYDQAHFARDFKRFTGQTPVEFLRNPLP